MPIIKEPSGDGFDYRQKFRQSALQQTPPFAVASPKPANPLPPTNQPIKNLSYSQNSCYVLLMHNVFAKRSPISLPRFGGSTASNFSHNVSRPEIGFRCDFSETFRRLMMR
jgi:hypothetical protein